MLTSLTLNSEISGKPVGYIIGDHKKVKRGDKLPVYIPKLLSGNPVSNYKKIITETSYISNISNIFLNSKNCRPIVRSSIVNRNCFYAPVRTFSEYTSFESGEKVDCDTTTDTIKGLRINLK